MPWVISDILTNFIQRLTRLCAPCRLPKPTNPIFSLIPNILMDAVIIAIIAYSVSLSMAQLFAKKHEYVVDANQELIAYVSFPTGHEGRERGDAS